MAEEKTTKERDLAVVDELPKVEIREGQDAEGNEYNIVKTNEALAEMLKILRKVEKNMLG